MKNLVLFVAGLFTTPVLILLVGFAGRLPSNATADPPGWETALGMRALDASLDRRAEGLENPIRAEDSAALATGRKIYATNCAGCHGSAQRPSDWGTRGFYPRVPQFWQEGS